MSRVLAGVLGALVGAALGVAVLRRSPERSLLERLDDELSPIRFWAFEDEDGDPVILDTERRREYGFTGSTDPARLRRLAVVVEHDAGELNSAPEGYFERTTTPEAIS